MLKICLVGAQGKMGRQLLDVVEHDPAITVSCGLSSPGAAVDEVWAGVPLSAGVPTEAMNVVVDFSSARGAMRALEVARSKGVPLVVGTTGLEPQLRDELALYSKDRAVVETSNFSVGMNMMFWLARQMGERLGPEFEAEVFEMHHRFKKDSPSGSALAIASEIARARDEDSNNVIVKGRAGMSEGRSSSEIGIASLRGGDVAGEHTMFFFGEGERIEVTHRVSNRGIFARGAVRAAKWVVSQPPGYYSMLDVLGLS